ncbi:DUF389 domain-containing protein [Leptolyngbya sp. BC1307]|uniref:DUF389 domain-containing protein n=1 Tax=Leptolyngbya sp. BC1307 TaxID=2029589 RepID=UPI001F0B1E82|nr:DUF389 domain-containing protein [Leptolyngbya sp. BC1307]
MAVSVPLVFSYGFLDDTMLNHIRSSLRIRVNPLQKTRVDPSLRKQLQADLSDESILDASYLILTVSACAIATLGLLTNSAAVIIGAMLIAPLMLPIRGLAFGALQGNVALFKKGVVAVASGTFLSIAIAYGIGMLVRIPSYGSEVLGSEVLARSAPNLLDLGIAVAAGSISGYAKVEPKVSTSLAGTAIAVALMPPVCVIGIGLAQANSSLSLGATLLYITNLLGITLACMFVFLLAGYSSFRRAKRALVWTLALTAVLVIPLSASFARLAQQARLESGLQQALVNRTVTFQRLELLRSETDWLTNPPEVRLNVRAKAPVTPRQVALLEEFIEEQTGQTFVLIFEVGEIKEVRREDELSE